MTAHLNAVLTHMWTPRQQLDLVTQSAQAWGQKGRESGMPPSMRENGCLWAPSLSVSALEGL